MKIKDVIILENNSNETCTNLINLICKAEAFVNDDYKTRHYSTAQMPRYCVRYIHAHGIVYRQMKSAGCLSPQTMQER